MGASEPRLAVLLPSPWREGERRDASAHLADLELLVGEAVEREWDGVFCAHHFLSEVPLLQPLTLLSHLASGSGDLDLGTCILILPLLNPVQLAEDVATLDQLSGGRVVLGVGAGYREHEFEGVGVPFAERGKRLVEYVALMRALWTGDPVSFDGNFFRLDGDRAGMLPRQPHPRIWIGAQREKPIRRAATIGDAWLAPANSPAPGWLERMAELPEHAESRDRPLLVEAFVGETDEQAQAAARPYLEAEYRAYQSHGSPDWFMSQFDQLMTKVFVVGDPDRVARRIAAYAAIGFDYFICRTAWGGIPAATAVESMRLLRSEAWPMVAERAGSAKSNPKTGGPDGE